MDISQPASTPWRRRTTPSDSRQSGSRRSSKPIASQESKAGFRLVLVYLLFEFGRPQELIPGLRAIPFGTALSVMIFMAVLMSGKLNRSFSRLQTKCWAALLPIMAIHVPIAANNYWALMTFKDHFLLFACYLGIATFIDSVDKMVTTMKMWVGILGFLAVMGIAKGGYGIGAWMGDENDFCSVMDMAAPFGYFMTFAATGTFQKLKYLGLLGSYILAAMASLSRGGFIGLASVGVYCWYRSPKKLNALILVFVAVLFMLVLAPDKYWDEMSSATSDQTMEIGTGAERLYTWGIGMEMFYANPLIGIGQSNFPWTFNIYEAGRTFNTKSIAGRQAHSAWVTLISELGLAGIFLIGGMLFQSYRDLKYVRTRFAPIESRGKYGQVKHRQIMQAGEDIRVYLARALEGSFIGYIVSSVFISTLWYPSMWILFGFVVALRNISEPERGEVPQSTAQTKYRMPSPMTGAGRTSRTGFPNTPGRFSQHNG